MHTPSERFTAATAAAVGKDESTVRRAAARGEALGDDLSAVTGTSLDKGVELDALAKLKINAPKFGAVYLDGKGEDRRCLNLPKRECLILVSGEMRAAGRRHVFRPFRNTQGEMLSAHHP